MIAIVNQLDQAMASGGGGLRRIHPKIADRHLPGRLPVADAEPEIVPSAAGMN